MQIFEEDDREYAPKRKVIKEEDDDAKKLKDSNRKVIVVEAKIDKEMYESDPDDDDAQNVQSGSSGMNCVKIGLPGKWILSKRVLLKKIFLGEPRCGS